MVIQTGILTLTAVEPEQTEALRALIGRTLPDAIVVLERRAPDERNWIEEILRRWCDETELDLIVTLGGTMPAPGPSGREIMPAATHAVLERPLAGLSEAMRLAAWEENPLGLLDGGLCGIRGRTLILNLPQGVRTAALFWSVVGELVAPILSHLHDASQAPSIDSGFAMVAPDPLLVDEAEPDDLSTRPAGAGLDPDEFARFLQRRRGPEGEADIE